MNSGKKSGAVGVGRDEEIAREEVVPGKFGDDADRQAITLVGADIAVERVELAVGESTSRREPTARRTSPRRWLGWSSPQSMCARCRLADEEFILRRAAGMLARIDDQLAVGAQHAFAARQRVLDERGSPIGSPRA